MKKNIFIFAIFCNNNIVYDFGERDIFYKYYQKNSRKKYNHDCIWYFAINACRRYLSKSNGGSEKYDQIFYCWTKKR